MKTPPTRTGITRIRERPEAEGVCAIQDCTKPHRARGYCGSHYQRLRRSGAFNTQLCSVRGCARGVEANEFCRMHYRRWLRSGNTDEPDPSRTNVNIRDVISYVSAHKRVYRTKGAARDQLCATCGAQATNWAYMNSDPDEQFAPNEGHYSLKIEHYAPLCTDCHTRADRARRHAEVLDSS